MLNVSKEIQSYIDLILQAKAERMLALRLKNDFFKRDF